MAMTIANMLVHLGVDMSDFEKKFSLASKRINKVGKDLENIGKKMSTRLSLPLLGAGTAALKLAGDMEQLQVAFTNFLGSADGARRMLDDLSQFAARTPFRFPELARATELMLAFGTSAEDVIPTLRAVGDAASAVGGGSETMERIVRALGQMRAKGKVSAEEMMQLAEAGIPAWEMLANVLGVTIPEAMKMAQQGAIDANTAISGLVSQMGERFGGMMKQQSKTLFGLLSTLRDNVEMAMRDIGNAMLPVIRELLPQMINKVRKLSQSFANLSDSTKRYMIIIAGAAALIGPLLIGLGGIARALASIGTVVKALAGGLSLLAAHPVVAAIAAIGVAVGIAVPKFIEWKKATKDVNDALSGMYRSTLPGLKAQLNAVNHEIETLTKRMRGETWWDRLMRGLTGEAESDRRRLEQLQKTRSALTAQMRELERAARRASTVSVGRRRTKEPLAVTSVLTPESRAELADAQKALSIVRGYRDSLDETATVITDRLVPAQRRLDENQQVITESIRRSTEGVNTFVDGVANFSGMIAGMATDVIMNFKNMGEVIHRILMQIVRDLIYATARALVFMAIMNFVAPGSVSLTRVLGGSIASVFGFGTRAFGLQSGGIVTRPTMAVVGEAGPEAVVPLDRLSMMWRKETIVVPVNIDGREITRVVVRRMPDELGRHGIAA